LTDWKRFISQERAVSSGFCPDARRDEGAYSQGSVTEEQRSVRTKDTENAPADLMKPLLDSTRFASIFRIERAFSEGLHSLFTVFVVC